MKLNIPYSSRRMPVMARRVVATGQPLAAQWPQFAARPELRFSAPDDAALAACDLVFFATPHGTAMAMAPALVERGVRVVDLSADFRLRSTAEFQQWYGLEHSATGLLAEAAYGLPEQHRERIRGARLVANPGCYPTCIALGLLPLLEAGLVETRGIVADAKSGVSGAGRKLALGVVYGEVAENFKAYGVDGHRHQPEIAQVLGDAAGAPVELTFVPHLLPMFRGMEATIYATARGEPGDLVARFRERYAEHPFVHVHDGKSVPETRSVRGANTCHLAVRHFPHSGRIVVMSVIDNLVKGASGQALQNANLMCGLAETAGLATDAFFP